MCYQNTIHNYLNTKNNDDIQFCKPQRTNYIIPTTSTPNHYSQSIGATSVSLLNLNTPTKLLSVSKEYMCFQIDGKYAQVAKCVKYRIITKDIDCVIFIDTFEQQYAVLKVMLQ